MAYDLLSMEKFCCGECGIEFGVPAHFARDCHEKGASKTWYCPNGHPRMFSESTSEKLRRERDRLQQQIARVEDEKREQLARAEKVEAANRRLKKRAAAGTCPCCQRTFQNMSTHMKRQHPEFVTDAGAKVVKFEAKSA